MGTCLKYAYAFKRSLNFGIHPYSVAIAFRGIHQQNVLHVNSKIIPAFLRDRSTISRLSFQRFRMIDCMSCGGIHVHHIHTSCARKKKHPAPNRHRASVSVKLKPKIRGEVVDVWINMTVEELAKTLKKDVDHVFEAMMFVDNSIDYDEPYKIIDRVQVIKDVVTKSGYRFVFVPNPAQLKIEKAVKDVFRRPKPDEKNLVKRPPVVTIMGHVDHGKTTLLDTLRNTSVVDQEFGGITQHIGAFTVKIGTGSMVTFLDTPGHAAFSAMRARGAAVTDIIVLVVAADDGVMPQTLESIQHASNAKVPMIVAINKMDKYNADIENTKKSLLSCGIVLEEQGGDIQAVPISALKGTNLNMLIDAIITQAEMMNLKGDPTGLVEGYVIESRTDLNKGKLATVIVQRGTLKTASLLVAGTAYAKVRAIYDENGQMLKCATPSTPVEVAGWKELPSAGDEVLQVETEVRAKDVCHFRNSLKQLEKQKEDYEVIKVKTQVEREKYKSELQQRRLEGRFKRKNLAERPKETIEVDKGAELAIILKGDVDGSVEALLNAISTYHSPMVKLDIINYGVGSVNENDVEMAQLFNGVIYAFNVATLPSAKTLATTNNVPIQNFNIIYRLIEDLRDKLKERLPQVEEDEVLGEARVVQEFLINDGRKKIPVAGCVCFKGNLKKSELFRLKRDDVVIYEGKVNSLRHLKNEVESIKKDVECGLRFEDINQHFEAGDVIECYKKVWVDQTINWDPGF
ncbi:hypothetical protein CHUAL_010664 [Chamberlinius hualienensis]